MSTHLEVATLLMQYVGAKRPTPLLSSEKDIEGLVGVPYDHVTISNYQDPVCLFWRLRQMGLLTPDAYVVFLGINRKDPSWRDLEQTYGGVMFGTLFLMQFRSTIRPGVLPSQRGMYMK